MEKALSQRSWLPCRINTLLDRNACTALLSLTEAKRLEQLAGIDLGKDALMRRAGDVVARWATALYPHAQRIWIACGAGNNGNDGLVAAKNLLRSGRQVIATLPPQRLTDQPRHWAHEEALQAGVVITQELPDVWDVCIDALLGIGVDRDLDGYYVNCTDLMRSGSSPILSIDVPSGLNAETGTAWEGAIKSHVTLALLTLKVGLFTADGLTYAGDIWFCDLAYAPEYDTNAVVAHLNSPQKTNPKPANTNKGDYGRVVVLGGEPCMIGASILAATSALQAGAGRVYVALLDFANITSITANCPALMTISWPLSKEQSSSVLLAGCGGGNIISAQLERALRHPGTLVLDADALNIIANSMASLDPSQNYEALLIARPAPTVITPHPLEAARLLGCTVREVQQNRLKAAWELVKRYHATVVLKGSGTIIASMGKIAVINTSGNARLATAGTGDVLAGMIAANLAQKQDAHTASCRAVRLHGDIADRWDPHQAWDAWCMTEVSSN